MNINWQALGVVVALLASIFSGSILFGEVRGQVERNTGDINQLKADGRASAKDLAEINEKLGRIETRMEILLPTSAVK